MRSKYIKFSDERNRKYSIETRFEQRNGVEKVIKSAIYPQGQKHIRNILHYAEILRSAYPNVTICPVEEIDGELCFDYIDGESLANLYARAAKQENVREIYRLLNQHKEIVLGGKDNQVPFIESEESREWFGILSDFDGQPGLKVSNYDAIASNIIMHGGRPVFIDYEWVFECVLPAELVLYHCIRDEYFHNEKLQEIVPLEKALSVLGIVKDAKKMDQAYKNFFAKVIHDDNGKSFAEMKFVCLKETQKVDQEIFRQLSEYELENARLRVEVSGLRKELLKTADYYKQCCEANRYWEARFHQADSVYEQFGGAEQVKRLLEERQEAAHPEECQCSEKHAVIKKTILWRGLRKIKHILIR